jgi:ribose-phosphate pyrophosphokinase
MSALLVTAMPGNATLARALTQTLDAKFLELELHAFPDGESYLRFLGEVAGRRLVIVCTLNLPNEKMVPLLFAAATARDLGAARVGLVAPYLAYMRQDRRFKPGEAVTSREIARLLSDAFDWLVTVDPHLHRYKSLSEIYRNPTRVVHAAPLISPWIRQNVPDALIIGPDSESRQWVAAVARDADAPYAVLDKVRRGDRSVEISIDNLPPLDGRTPVLVDDIISSGRTMIEAVRLIRTLTAKPAVCIAVHGLFSDSSDRILARAGARVITSNTIPHATNEVDVSGLLASSIKEVLDQVQC